MAAGGDNIIGNLQVDTFLTNYSESWFQDQQNFISSAASTLIPVTTQGGIFLKYPKSYFLRDEMEPRPLGGAPVQVSYGVERGSYAIDEYALEHYIDDRQRAQVNVPSINLDMNATRLLTSKAMIRRDRLWATTFFKTGVWTTDYTGVAAAPTGNQFLQWDQAGANPTQIVLRAKTAIQLSTGKLPNTMVVGANVHNWLLQSPYIIDLVKYSQRGIITNELLASLFGVEQYRVAQAVYNAAQEKVTPDATNLQWIVDANAVWLGYVDRAPAMDSPTAIANFVWTGLIPGATNNNGGVITRGRDGRAYSDFFHIRDANQFQAVAADLGAFFADAVSGAL